MDALVAAKLPHHTVRGDVAGCGAWERHHGKKQGQETRQSDAECEHAHVVGTLNVDARNGLFGVEYADQCIAAT